MKAVFKRELKSYYTSVLGWIFYAAFFFVFDLYFVANNLSYGSPYISYSLGNVLFIFIIIIPILAMRCMADDRKTKTDQLLYTSPVSIPKVIIGKYLALVAVFSIAMGVVCLCPLVLSTFGDVPMAENYTLIFGVWLYGCMTLAICVFISSLTESQVIAAVLSFALLFVGFMMEAIIGFVTSADNILTQFLSALSTAGPIDNFEVGIFDVPGTVYYVSGTVLFLFLTCQVVQKYRWSVSTKKFKTGVFNTSYVVIGVAIAVAVNVFANQLPDGIKNIDVTSQQLYSLTDETYTVLDDLESDVTMYVLCAEDDMDSIVAQTLERYDAGSNHVTVEYIDPAESPTFYTNYTDDAPADGSVIVVCGERSTIVDYSDMYETEIDYTTYSYETTGYDGEGLLTSAITYVVNEDMPVVYTVTGHSESSFDSDFTAALEKLNISVEDITLLEYDEIPEDAAAIIINAPVSDFSSDDAQKVIDYLDAGGKALIITSFAAEDDMSNFESILEHMNIELTTGLIFEDDTSYYYQAQYYLLPDVQSATATSDVDGYIFMPYAEAISNTDEDSETISWTDLLLTSSDAYLKSDIDNLTTVDREDTDTTGQFSLAAVVTDSDTGAEVTVVTSPYIFTEDADSMVSGQNLSLFKGIVSGYSDDDAETTTVSIDVKDYSYSTLTVSSKVIISSEILLMVVAPIALLVIGILIWFRRKRA